MYERRDGSLKTRRLHDKESTKASDWLWRACVIVTFVTSGASFSYGETPTRSGETAASLRVLSQERLEGRSEESEADEVAVHASVSANGDSAPKKEKKGSGTKASKKVRKGVGKDSVRDSGKGARRSTPRYLELERRTRRAEPLVVEGLTTGLRFTRRLPPHWSEVNVTEEQKLEIYALQEAYFLELVQLQARIDRLKAERDEAQLQILSREQRDALERVLKKSEDEKKEAAEPVEIIFND